MTDPRHEDRRLPSPVPEGWDAVIQETVVPPLAQPTAQHVAQDRGAHFQSLIWCATGLGNLRLFSVFVSTNASVATQSAPQCALASPAPRSTVACV